MLHPSCGQVGQVVDVGDAAEHGGTVGGDPPVGAAVGVDGWPGDGVPVLVADGFDAGAEDPGPAHAGGDAVEAYAGEAVVAAGSAPGGWQYAEALLEVGEDGAAGLGVVVVDVDAEDVGGQAEGNVAGAAVFGPCLDVGVGGPGAVVSGVAAGDGCLGAGREGEDSAEAGGPVEGCGCGVGPGGLLGGEFGCHHLNQP